MNTILACCCEPVKVIYATQGGGMNPVLIVSTIALIVTTAKILYDVIKIPKVFGKVISRTVADNGSIAYFSNKERVELKGQNYLLRISLTCLTESLSYKEVKVYLTYKNGKTKGEIYWADGGTFSYTSENLEVKKYRTKLNPSEFLPFNSVLEAGKVGLYYLTFNVPDRAGEERYEKLELEFVKPNGQSYTIEVPDIDEKQWLRDESIFEEVKF